MSSSHAATVVSPAACCPSAHRLRVWQRSRTQPDYAQEVVQRFGGFAPARTQGAVWIHAVSVGETNAAQPVIQFFWIKVVRCW